MTMTVAEIWNGMHLLLRKADKELDEARTSLAETLERLQAAEGVLGAVRAYRSCLDSDEHEDAHAVLQLLMKELRAYDKLAKEGR